MSNSAQRYATPLQIFKRAVALEHEAETFAAVGMYRTARDKRDAAGDLRRLAREASANLGRQGE